MGERWVPVPGWEGLYEVSDHGRVRSLDRTIITGKGPRRYQGRVLKPTVDSRGYPTVKLSSPERGQVTRMVHHLVLEAHVGPIPPGQETRHGPGGKLDSSLANLCYGTRSENVGEDRLRDGQSNRGERHGRAVTTREAVIDIRERVANGERQADLAAEYGLTKANVWAIVHRISWDWV